MDNHLTDHDMLIGLRTDMCWLKKVMGNHLRHHWMITLCALGALLSTAGALVIILLR